MSAYQKIIAHLLFIVLFAQSSQSQNLYFPPINNSLPWDTLSPINLGWCSNEIDTLYDYLLQQDTKAFIVLKDGKIVLEKYFGTFTQDSLWYWASAGKTITSFLIGKAQEENYLSIQDTSSKYLGVGWSNCLKVKEDKIKIFHHLTMTTGLNDGVLDNHCTIDTCLNYLSDAGTRWAYHNAPYTLLENVISNATGTNINSYTQNKLKTKTGMNGFWFTSGYDNVFFSKARSMARFGLLIQNNCIWNTDTLLFDTTYKKQMVNASQNLNLSYGYLWWLSGKNSFMVPGSQIVFPGTFTPNAPNDVISAIGSNGQLLSISKTKGIVFVRMGNQIGAGEVPFLLCDKIWANLNNIMCSANSVNTYSPIPEKISIYPNPSNEYLNIKVPLQTNYTIKIYNNQGALIYSNNDISRIEIKDWAKGLYHFVLTMNDQLYKSSFIKN
jgi:CubicO group peptidase (beta-lactamase class C family)